MVICCRIALKLHSGLRPQPHDATHIYLPIGIFPARLTYGPSKDSCLDACSMQKKLHKMRTEPHALYAQGSQKQYAPINLIALASKHIEKSLQIFRKLLSSYADKMHSLPCTFTIPDTSYLEYFAEWSKDTVRTRQPFSLSRLHLYIVCQK